MKHGAFALTFPALLVFSVFACKAESTAPISSAETNDASLADAALSSFPDSAPSSTTDAADAAICTGHLSGYVPPHFQPKAMQSCTTADIDAYVAACGPDDYAPECLAWKADAKNGTCKSCIFRQDDSGPFHLYSDGTFASLNEGACVAMQGDPACGASIDASYHCALAACGDCPRDPDAGQITGACYEKIYGGDCKKYADTESACDSTLAGAAADCLYSTTTWTPRLRMTITLLCGIPSDGGSGDAGPADAAGE